MSVRAYVLEEQTEHRRTLAFVPEPEPLSPELILVLPPAEAQAARERLPDVEPFDEWLHRLRAAEVVSDEPDWELEPDALSRRRLGGALFAAACVLNAVLPVVLFLAVH
jgi:hypothetical protein